jgi:type IV pilus assembly protein PilM
MEDAVVDYDILDEFEQEGARMLRLLVVAAQKEMLDRLVGSATAARVEPVGVDLVPFALIRAVGQDGGLGLEESRQGGEAIVDVGADVTNICVHDRGLARFVRILPSGGRDVTKAMSDSLGISEEEAENLKRGLPTDDGPAPEEVESVRRARVARLVDEIRSSLDFYRAQTPGVDISHVLVTGGGSKVPGMIESLAERLASPVEQGHAFSKVAVRLDMDEATVADAEPLLAVALGLALPED